MSSISRSETLPSHIGLYSCKHVCGLNTPIFKYTVLIMHLVCIRPLCIHVHAMQIYYVTTLII